MRYELSSCLYINKLDYHGFMGTGRGPKILKPETKGYLLRQSKQCDLHGGICFPRQPIHRETHVKGARQSCSHERVLIRGKKPRFKQTCIFQKVLQRNEVKFSTEEVIILTMMTVCKSIFCSRERRCFPFSEAVCYTKTFAKVVLSKGRHGLCLWDIWASRETISRELLQNRWRNGFYTVDIIKHDLQRKYMKEMYCMCYMLINMYFICSSKISCMVSEVSGMFLRRHQGGR